MSLILISIEVGVVGRRRFDDLGVVTGCALKVFDTIPQPASTSCLNPMEMGDRGFEPWDTYPID